MNFYEFLEALARTAEKLSLIPLGLKSEKTPLEQRRLLPLHLKIEGLLLAIFFRLGDTIKKTMSDLYSEELTDFDTAILGSKRV
jgi:hypothetical protein